MKLVFVRHGKAQNPTPGMDDASRRLTFGGCKDLAKSMPGLKLLIGDQKNIRLWSSPLLRAIQSASIIACEFELKEPEIYDFISSGDFASLANELGKMDSEANELAKMDSDSNDTSSPLPDCLIIVGHQPQLSDWCQGICGEFIIFEKGGAVGMDLISLSPLKGTVEWIANPKSVKDKKNQSLLQSGLTYGNEDSNPNPEINKKNPAINELIKILQHFLQEIQKAQKKFLEEPEEIENLHQLRVNIRKFRSLLSFTSPLLSKDDYKINQEKIQKVSQLFSYIRELDVLLVEWNTVVSKQVIEIPNPNTLSVILKETRDKERERLQNLLALKDDVLTTTLLNLRSWLSDVSVAHEVESGKSLETYADQRIKKWQNGIRKELMEIETFEFPRIHLLRIKSKKLRYIQEIFIKKNSPKRNSSYIAKVKDLQEILGIICDTRRNIEIINKLFETDKSLGVSLERNIFIWYLMGKETGLHYFSDLTHLI